MFFGKEKNLVNILSIEGASVFKLTNFVEKDVYLPVNIYKPITVNVLELHCKRVKTPLTEACSICGCRRFRGVWRLVTQLRKTEYCGTLVTLCNSVAKNQPVSSPLSDRAKHFFTVATISAVFLQMCLLRTASLEIWYEEVPRLASGRKRLHSNKLGMTLSFRTFK